MKIRPAGHRIVVIPDVSETEKRANSFGLVIAESEARAERASVDTGVVESIGPTAFLDFVEKFGGAPWCKVGDRIAFAKYGGKVIGEGKYKRIVLNDEDVVAILETEHE